MKVQFHHKAATVVTIIYIIIISILLSSCSHTKDRKALGRVLTNPDLIAQVAKTLPPCANDTTIISDSIYIIDTEVMYDTALVTDTLIDIVDRVKAVTKTVTVDKIRTIEKIVLDTRLANQWRDTSDKYKAFYIVKDHNLNEALQRGKDLKKTNIILWLVIALLVLGMLLYIGFKLKKP